MRHDAMQCAAKNHSLQGFLAAAVELTLNDITDVVLPSDADERSLPVTSS